MRFALCDDDPLFADIAESLLDRLGHDVVGVAHTPAEAVALIERARPEAVVVDIAMGFGSDFDMVESALSNGAATIVFSQKVDIDALDRYERRPAFVPKPDFDLLEATITRVALAPEEEEDGPPDRRVRPQRAAQGPPATGVGDAMAFYEALNNAEGGDALVALDLPDGSSPQQATVVAEILTRLIRSTDRLLASGSGVRVYLAGAEAEGRDALVARLQAELRPDEGARITSALVQPGEAGADAFGRLRNEGTIHA